MPKALKQNWIRNVREFDSAHAYAWTFLTKEEFKKLWATLDKHDTVIVDEAHHFAGTKSQLTKTLRAYLKKWKVPYRLFLTATPYRSSPWDIYTLAKHLGYDWSWPQFDYLFFEDKYVGRGRKIRSPKPDIENDIAALVAKIGDIVNIEDCADIPEQVFDVETFDLTKDQEKAKLNSYDANTIVRFTHHHEIENGFLKGDGYVDDQFFTSNKEERIVELCEETDKVIVVCRYHGQMAQLASKLSALPKPVFQINGKVRDRHGVVLQAEEAKRAVVLVQAACSEGYELPSFPLMIFASLDFSYVNYKQMLGRILRLNKLKKNVYLHLVSKGIDAAVYSAIMNKKDFDLAIYAHEHSTQNTIDEDPLLFGERFSD